MTEQGPAAGFGDPALQAHTVRVDVRVGVSRRELRFASPVVTIGRSVPGQPGSPDIDLQQDQSVSRQHAEMRWTASRLCLVDQGSTNGTWLNGERLTPGEPRWLRSGDRIAVGRLSVLTVYLSGAEDAGTAPPV